MTPRIQITLAIILAIAIGCGFIVFGVMVVAFGSGLSKEATLVAVGVTILAAGFAGLIAHAIGCFRDLDDKDL